MRQIYIIKNLVNKKVYVGQTIRTIEFRYGNNGIQSVLVNTHNEHLKKSIVKYGVENFTIEIVYEKIKSKKELDILEQELIIRYESYKPDKGYNKLISHSSMGELSEKKIICLNDGKIYDSMTKASEYYNVQISKISLVCNGKRKHTKQLVFKFYDEDNEYEIIGFSKETKRQVKRYPVICVNDGKVYESITECANYYGIGTDSVSSCCRKRNRMTTEGLQFDFYEEGKEYKLNKEYVRPTKKVKCIDTGEIFNSVEEVCNKYKTGRNNVSSVLRGRSKTAKGLRFEYIDELHEENKFNKMKHRSDYKDNKKKAIICLETNTVHESIKEAARMLNISYSNISRALRDINKTANGLHFMIYEEGKNYSETIEEVTKEKEIVIPNHAEKKVICINTGEIFKNCVEAAISKGYKNGNNISVCCRNKTKEAYGMQWAYYEEGKEYKVNEDIKYYGRKVKCLETGTIYLSARHAEDKTGIHSGSITANCHGKYSHSGGYHWTYDLESKEVYEIIDNRILCLNDGKVFETYKEVAEHYGFKSGQYVSDMVNNNGRRVISGYRFVKYNEDYNFVLTPIIKKRVTPKRVGTKIRCIETNIIYNTLKEVIKEHGVDSRTIKFACENNTFVKGYHWEYVK